MRWKASFFAVIALYGLACREDAAVEPSTEIPPSATPPDSGTNLPDAAPTPRGEFRSAFTFPVGGSTEEEGVVVTFDAQGNLFLAYPYEGTPSILGRTLDPSLGGTDIALVKIGASGEVLWTRSYGSTTRDAPLAIATDATGDVYLSMQLSAPFAGKPATHGALIGKIRGADGEPIAAWMPTLEFDCSSPESACGQTPTQARCPSIAVNGDRVAAACVIFWVTWDPYGSKPHYLWPLAALDLTLAPQWTVDGRGSLLSFTADGDVSIELTKRARADGHVLLDRPSDLAIPGEMKALTLVDGTDYAIGGRAVGGMGSAGGFVARVNAQWDIAPVRTLDPVDPLINNHYAYVTGAVRDGSGNVLWVGRYDGAFALAELSLPDPKAQSAFIMKTDASLSPLWLHGMPASDTFGAEISSISVGVDPRTDDSIFAGAFSGLLDLGDGKPITTNTPTGFVVRRSF